MTRTKPIEDRFIRTCWSEEHAAWYFVINDAIGILTKSPDPHHTVKRLRRNNPHVRSIWEELPVSLEFFTLKGRQNLNCMSALDLVQVICCMNSKRVSLLRGWLEGLDIDPQKNTRDIYFSRGQMKSFYEIVNDPKDWKKRKREFMKANEELPYHQRFNDLEMIFACLKKDDLKHYMPIKMAK